MSGAAESGQFVNLRQLVKQRRPDDLWPQLERIWQKAEELLGPAEQTSDGQQRGIAHAKMVEANAGHIAGRCAPDLRPAEAFVLSAAAALHDVARGAEGDHGDAAADAVRGLQEVQDLSGAAASVLADVVAAHSKQGQELYEAVARLRDHDVYPELDSEAPIRLRRLALVFKLADLLDTTTARVTAPPAALSTRVRTVWAARACTPSMRVEKGRLVLNPKAQRLAEWDAFQDLLSHIQRGELDPIGWLLRDQGLPSVIEAEGEPPERDMPSAPEQSPSIYPFREGDSAIFRGRDQLARKLVGYVKEHPLTIVSGVSGAGKTSVLAAGLVPEMEARGWYCVLSRPTTDPRRLWLKEDLDAENAAEAVQELKDMFEADRRLRGVLLVLDQLEDLVIYGSWDREWFEEEMRQLLGASDWLRVVVAYRADYDGYFGPPLRNTAGPDGPERFYVEFLRRKDAVQALKAAPELAELEVEENVWEAVAEDVEKETQRQLGWGRPGCYPPYIQMVIPALVRAASQGRLSMEAYKGLGEDAPSPVAAAIAEYLQSALGELKGKGLKPATGRRVLEAIVHPEAGAARRGRASVMQIAAWVGVTEDEAKHYAAALVDLRLLARLEEGVYEIAHDYLAERIWEELSPEERGFRAAMDALRWKARQLAQGHVQELTEEEQRRLYANRGRVVVGDEERVLLLRTALKGLPEVERRLEMRPDLRLREGVGWFWVGRDADELLGAVRVLLNDRAAAVRSRAYRTLGDLGTEEDVKVIGRRLGGEQIGVRAAALAALVKVAKRVGVDVRRHVLEMAKDVHWEVGVAAYEALGEVGAGEDLEVIRRGLGDWAEDVRAAALRALVKVAKRAGVDVRPDVLEMVEHTNWRVREAAHQVLGEVGTGEDLEVIMRGLADWDEDIRAAALSALVKVARRVGVHVRPDVLYMLRRRDAWVRGAAYEALGEVGTEKDLEVIRRGLEDSDIDVRAAAVRAFVKVAKRTGVGVTPDVLDMAKHGNRRVREAAYGALADVGTPDDLELVSRGLEERYESLRVAAATAVAGIAGRCGRAVVQQVLEKLNVYAARLDVLSFLDFLGYAPEGLVREVLEKLFGEKDEGGDQ